MVWFERERFTWFISKKLGSSLLVSTIDWSEVYWVRESKTRNGILAKCDKLNSLETSLRFYNDG